MENDVGDKSCLAVSEVDLLYVNGGISRESEIITHELE